MLAIPTARRATTRRTATRRAALGLTAAAAGAVVLGRTTTAGADGGRLIGPAQGDDLHVMTYNIRVQQESRPGEPDHWDDRSPLVSRLLRAEQPTLLGLQETTAEQLETVGAALPDHEVLGFGFGTETLAGFPALSYDTTRLEALDLEQWGFSETPEDPDAISWRHTFPRSAAMVRFADRRTGRELVVLNTHLDHESELARVRSAEMIRERLADVLAAGGAPVVVTGDFNAEAGRSVPWSVMTGDGVLRDTWETASVRDSRDWGTFPNYGPALDGGRRIDWVLATEGVSVRRAAVNVATYDTAVGEDRWPSDHVPVQALVRLT